MRQRAEAITLGRGALNGESISAEDNINPTTPVMDTSNKKKDAVKNFFGHYFLLLFFYSTNLLIIRG